MLTELNKTLSVKPSSLYLTANGLIIKIVAKEISAVDYIYIGTNTIEYNFKGHDVRDNHHNDLIAEIPEDLHKELIQVVKDYYEK